jgi:transcriptional regulator with XRE-family HTH domain
VSKPDWAKIRAEYITGGISQRKLAAKYGVSFGTLAQKANAEKWAKQRNETYNKSITKAQQKKANETASNAVKLEQAKGLLIDKLKRAIEQMPESAGTHSRQYISKGDKKMTVDYDLLEMVTALEKLAKDDDSKGGDPVTIVWGR